MHVMEREIISPIEFDDFLIGKGIDYESSVYFSIPGKPRGKERPRSHRVKNFITTYTPKNTVEYENKIKKCYKEYTNNVKLEGYIEAEITAIFPIPKSIKKKDRQEMEQGNVRCRTKPDCDNIAKVILDPLNEIAYDDDSQVCSLKAEKFYGIEPQVKVILRKIERTSSYED